MNYVNIENLSFSYEDKKIFDNVNMFINKGEFISLLGANNSGKTTFFKLIKGTLECDGKITIESEENIKIKEKR